MQLSQHNGVGEAKHFCEKVMIDVLSYPQDVYGRAFFIEGLRLDQVTLRMADIAQPFLSVCDN